MASVGSTIRVFRDAAKRFSTGFFTCRQCIQNQAHAGEKTQRWMGVLHFPKPSRFSSGIRKQNSYGPTTMLKSASFASLSKPVSAGTVGRKAQFPETSEKVVAYWLLGSATSVFGIVVFGGLTRLTESGFVSLRLCDRGGQEYR